MCILTSPKASTLSIQNLHFTTFILLLCIYWSMCGAHKMHCCVVMSMHWLIFSVQCSLGDVLQPIATVEIHYPILLKQLLHHDCNDYFRVMIQRWRKCLPFLCTPFISVNWVGVPWREIANRLSIVQILFSFHMVLHSFHGTAQWAEGRSHVTRIMM